MKKQAAAWLAGWAMIVASIVPSTTMAKDQKVKYAKTEVDRAVGKCVGSVLGGALLGALVGGLVGGKKGVGAGVAVGAAAGVGVCAVLINNAKRKDRIIAAQIESATHVDRTYVTEFGDDNGQVMHFTGNAGNDRLIDSAALLPVKYKTGAGEDMASPMLDTGGQECRTVSSTLSGNGSASALPDQLVCRTSEGDWRPYARKSA